MWLASMLPLSRNGRFQVTTFLFAKPRLFIIFCTTSCIFLIVLVKMQLLIDV